METIFLKDVLEQMELKDSEGYAVPFDIELREFSNQNKTGGKYKIYNDARLLITKPKHKHNFHRNQSIHFEEKVKKNPNHSENHTRNIELANGEIKTINRHFIIKFNGKKVNP